MHFFGATVIAGAVFFVLNFLSSELLGGPEMTSTRALVEAVIKTAVFATAFHYVHNWCARLFGWYRTDDPDAAHLFDRNPALDAEREARGRQ